MFLDGEMSIMLVYLLEGISNYLWDPEIDSAICNRLGINR